MNFYSNLYVLVIVILEIDFKILSSTICLSRVVLLFEDLGFVGVCLCTSCIIKAS